MMIHVDSRILAAPSVPAFSMGEGSLSFRRTQFHRPLLAAGTKLHLHRGGRRAIIQVEGICFSFRRTQYIVLFKATVRKLQSVCHVRLFPTWTRKKPQLGSQARPSDSGSILLTESFKPPSHPSSLFLSLLYIDIARFRNLRFSSPSFITRTSPSGRAPKTSCVSRGRDQPRIAYLASV